jgi:hypothetical protein
MSKMPHDWQGVRFLHDECWCKRCGLRQIEHERNLSASQSTHLYVTFWRDGKSLDYDPGCVERDP